VFLLASLVFNSALFKEGVIVKKSLSSKGRLAETVILLAAASAMTIVLAACGQVNTSQDKESGKTSSTASKATASESQKPQTTTPQVETSGTATSSIDTCSLITKEEAKDAAAGEVENATGDKENCRYVSKNGMVMIDNFPGSSPAGMDSLIASRAMGNAEPLAGVGDKAVLINPPREGINAKSVFVLKGNVVLMITLNRKSPTVTADEIKELTAKVVSRLP
jgi:hypothetical protein